MLWPLVLHSTANQGNSSAPGFSSLANSLAERIARTSTFLRSRRQGRSRRLQGLASRSRGLLQGMERVGEAIRGLKRKREEEELGSEKRRRLLRSA